MTTNLDDIKQRIKTGDTEGARGALVTLLQANPQNADGWELLATILDEPARQADCYRQILRINPSNRYAAERLQALASRSMVSSSQGQPTPDEEAVLLCKQCGGAMEVRFIGEMQDKRAICSHCGTDVDLPDSFRRVQKKREHERSHLSSRTVEETVNETRQDGQNVSFDPEAFDPEALKALQERGYDIYSGPKLEHSSKTVTTTIESEDKSPLGWLFRGLVKKKQPDMLTPEEVIKLAGDPLPLAERRTCPNPQCGAVISKKETKCPWCSQALPAEPDTV